jgi:hypothetical protein
VSEHRKACDRRNPSTRKLVCRLGGRFLAGPRYSPRSICNSIPRFRASGFAVGGSSTKLELPLMRRSMKISRFPRGFKWRGLARRTNLGLRVPLPDNIIAFTHTSTRTSTSTSTRTRTRTRTRIYRYVCVGVCVYVCMYVCMYVCRSASLEAIYLFNARLASRTFIPAIEKEAN